MSRRTKDRWRSTALETAPPVARVPSTCLLLFLVLIHPSDALLPHRCCYPRSCASSCTCSCRTCAPTIDRRPWLFDVHGHFTLPVGRTNFDYFSLLWCRSYFFSTNDSRPYWRTRCTFGVLPPDRWRCSQAAFGNVGGMSEPDCKPGMFGSSCNAGLSVAAGGPKN